MKIGIVGLPQSGKTTIYNILTDAGAATGVYHAEGHDSTNLHMVQVVDDRLDRLHALFPTSKKIYSTNEYIDVAGIIKEKGKDESQEKAVFSHLLGVDMLLVVLRAFEDSNIPHSEGSVDPERDLDIFQTELLLRDLQIVENRLKRLEKTKSKSQTGAMKLEWELLNKCRDNLSKEIPLRELLFEQAESKLLHGFQFMSGKPLLVVLNIGESGILKIKELSSGLEEQESHKNIVRIAVCGKLEMELSQMDSEEAGVFMEEYGIEKNAADILTWASRDLLNQITFFTIGDDEVRAWPIPKNTRAREAAGAIHSDLEKGFIRAEVVFWEDMIARGSLAKCKTDGVLRLEGKDYPVNDGDIVSVLFNV